MAIMINFVEKLNNAENNNDCEKQAHELVVAACALALTEITQQINRVLNILYSEQESENMNCIDVVNNIFSERDKAVLVELCSKHGENLVNFAKLLDAKPENVNSKFMSSMLDNVVTEFPDSEYVIVDRYMETILSILKNDSEGNAEE